MMKQFKLKKLVVALTQAGLATFISNTALANPQNGNVVAGNVNIQQESATKLGITQTSNKAIVDWQRFSIAPNEHTQFYMPSASSVILNRVVGQAPSAILGRMTANGQVFLVNPNGIFFGKNAQIDVAGLVATTHNIKNADFLAGHYNFNIPGKPGASVINEGMIRISDTGIAAFVAPSVANDGVIAAKLGKIELAAANGFTLDFYGDNLLSFMVDDKLAQTAFDMDGKPLTSFVENSGRIEAQGGYVLLTAKGAENAVHSVINQSGVIEATTVDAQHKGEIVLSGGEKGLVSNSGTLDASGKDKGKTGGSVQITGERISLASSSQIDVSGDLSGGKAIIGGDYLGGKATDKQLAETGMVKEAKVIPTATTVQVAAGAKINADALDKGNGGKVVVWADSKLNFDGSISAKGGVNSGNGGLVETSGKELLASGNVDASAKQGSAGLWFMDPLDVIISDSFGGTISASSIVSSLNSGTTVTVSTDESYRPGSITLLSDIAKTSGGDATLNLFSLDGAVILNRGARIVSTSGKLNVNINAQKYVDNPIYSLVAIGNDNDYAISSNGGDVDIEGLIQTYQGKAVSTNGGAFRARTTPSVSSGSPQADARGFIGIGPTPINSPDSYTINVGYGNISMRATGGTITLDNHALATGGTATLTAEKVLAQPNILSFNIADEAERENIESGLSGEAGYGANFPGNDDNSIPVDISILSGSQGLKMLGTNFGNTIYLSNNGYMRLDALDGSYTPYSITNTTNPIVAAYFGDVDTRSGLGNVYYQTIATNTDNKAVLTWIDTGYYSVGGDKRNTFQLQLENLGQEVNMRMSYDKLQWTTGEASNGVNGLGGEVARAGLHIEGTNQIANFELPGSGNQTAMLALADLPGNTGHKGRWSFRLWSNEIPPSQADGRYEVAANTFTVKDDTGQPVYTPTQVRDFPVEGQWDYVGSSESPDYRRNADYGSRLDALFASRYGLELQNIKQNKSAASQLARVLGADEHRLNEMMRDFPRLKELINDKVEKELEEFPDFVFDSNGAVNFDLLGAKKVNIKDVMRTYLKAKYTNEFLSNYPEWDLFVSCAFKGSCANLNSDDKEKIRIYEKELKPYLEEFGEEMLDLHQGNQKPLLLSFGNNLRDDFLANLCDSTYSGVVASKYIIPLKAYRAARAAGQTALQAYDVYKTAEMLPELVDLGAQVLNISTLLSEKILSKGDVGNAEVIDALSQLNKAVVNLAEDKGKFGQASNTIAGLSSISTGISKLIELSSMENQLNKNSNVPNELKQIIGGLSTVTYLDELSRVLGGLNDIVGEKVPGLKEVFSIALDAKAVSSAFTNQYKRNNVNDLYNFVEDANYAVGHFQNAAEALGNFANQFAIALNDSQPPLY